MASGERTLSVGLHREGQGSIVVVEGEAISIRSKMLRVFVVDAVGASLVEGRWRSNSLIGTSHGWLSLFIGRFVAEPCAFPNSS